MKIPTEKLLFSSTWKSPSNIALVKYWGKRKNQIPENPSISFSLSKSYSHTQVNVLQPVSKEIPSYEFFFEGQRQLAFEDKISVFLKRVYEYIPAVSGLRLQIKSSNTFPHSSGIASSASAMSALSLALLDLEQLVSGKYLAHQDFLKTASIMSRLGSGSAARSVYGGYTMWGKLEEMDESSDEYAIPVNKMVHQNFKSMYDSILIVEAGSKSVSSTMGHSLMKNNPYAPVRYKMAIDNTISLLKILKEGDFEKFIALVESEAMTLHALMMASSPWFILMQANTIKLIKKIVDFRKQNAVPLCFTLDAGPNIHLIYPEKARPKVLSFIENELLEHLSNSRWIDDKIGDGPEKLNNQ
jgi:diphosphomevalonate decarboxylase